MADNAKGSSKPILLQPVNLQCKNLHDYLKTRPPELLERLYNHPAICLAVYRCFVISLYIGIVLYSVIITENYQN